MQKLIARWLPAATLATWSAVLFFFHFSEQMKNMLAPEFRYYAFAACLLDEEAIWLDVQRWGGHISVRGDCIDFYVPTIYAAFFTLKYPELPRQPLLEYL